MCAFLYTAAAVLESRFQGCCTFIWPMSGISIDYLVFGRIYMCSPCILPLIKLLIFKVVRFVVIYGELKIPRTHTNHKE